MTFDEKLLRKCQKTNDKKILQYVKKGMKDENFGIALNRACLDRKKTLTSISREIGSSVQTISNYSRNKELPSLLVTVILESILKVPVGYFQALILRERINKYLEKCK